MNRGFIDMEIVEKHVENYIKEHIPTKDSFFCEMEQYAKEYYVPIISPESLRFLETILLLHKPKKILEIGTAIGYSALNFCRILKGDCTVTTYERNQKRYDTAKAFITRSEYSNNIDVVYSDATEGIDLRDAIYDMAFIDAGKSQYQFFFDQIYPHIKKGGILVSDNVLFRGEVCQKSELDVTKRNRTIYRRMNNYLSFLMTENNRFHTSLIPIGDGMAVTIKMEDEMILR